MKAQFRFKEKGVYRAVNAGLLACMGLFGAGWLFGLGDLSGIHVLAAAVFFGVFAGSAFLPVRGRILCLWAALICLCVAAAAWGLENSLAFVQFYFTWLAGNAGPGEAWTRGCELIQTGLLVAASCLLQRLLEKFPRLKLCFAGLLFAALLYCMLSRIHVAHSGVAFLLCYMAMVYAEWIQGRWKKVRSGSTRLYMFWIMPFLLLYFLLMLCMPVWEKPYEWKWVKKIYSQMRETFISVTQSIHWGRREGFDMTLSGFSGDGELRGDMREEVREVMTIQGPKGLMANVYLTGMVYDTFDGRQWQQEYRGNTGTVYLDTAETLSAVRSYNRTYERDYRAEVRLKIRYTYFNSGYLFAPLKTWNIASDDKNFSFTGRGGNLLLEGYRGYGTEYEARYFQLNMGQEEFYRFLEEGQEADEAVWEEILREYEWKNGEKVTLEAVEDYRREIYAGYSGEITLSREVADYLGEITENAVTDVDKLRAIERELASFSYTRTPGKLPDWIESGSDFLDYFLTESRQGYCTYFATAFVLLARAEGFPARYVQGYCVPMQENGETYVYSNMAHAWPEVYIAGVGWIPFEPTPGYAEIRYTPWQLRQPDRMSVQDGKSESVGQGEPGEMPEEISGAAAESAEPGVQAETENPEAEEASGFPWRSLGYAVLAILTGCAGILILDNVLGRYRYRRMSPEEKFRTEVFRNLTLLSWFGLEKQDWETLQELRERAELLPELEGETAGRSPVQFIEDYENVIYGGKLAGEEAIESAGKDRRALLEWLKKKRPRVYFWCRLRLYLVRYR